MKTNNDLQNKKNLLTILFCKWDLNLLQYLLEDEINLILILDDFDIEHIKLDNDIFNKITKFYRVSQFDSIDELSAIYVDISQAGFTIDRIVSPAEYSQYGAGFLSSLFKPTNFSLDLAVASRDKRVMKSLVRKSGIKTAKFVSIPDYKDLNQRQKVKEEIGFPLVIKPVNGLGTMTTAKIHSFEKFNHFLDNIKFEAAIHSNHLIAESFIDGEEYHVDALWENSEPLLISISKYHVPRLKLSIENNINGSYILPKADYKDLYEKITNFNIKVNKEIGVHEGITHLEFFIEKNSGDFIFSEIATRYGGAAVIESLQEKFGADIKKGWSEQLKNKSNIRELFHENPTKYIGWINLSPKNSGKVVFLPDEEKIKSTKGILRHELIMAIGDSVSLSHPSVWGLLLVIGADTIEKYHDLIENISNELQIITE
jgi:ATP-grasp domain